MECRENSVIGHTQEWAYVSYNSGPSEDEVIHTVFIVTMPAMLERRWIIAVARRIVPGFVNLSAPFSQGRVCFTGSLSPKAGFVSTGAFLPRQGLFQREPFSQGRVCFNGSLSPKAGFVSTGAFLPRQGLFQREPFSQGRVCFTGSLQRLVTPYFNRTFFIARNANAAWVMN